MRNKLLSLLPILFLGFIKSSSGQSCSGSGITRDCLAINASFSAVNAAYQDVRTNYLNTAQAGVGGTVRIPGVQGDWSGVQQTLQINTPVTIKGETTTCTSGTSAVGSPYGTKLAYLPPDGQPVNDPDDTACSHSGGTLSLGQANDQTIINRSTGSSGQLINIDLPNNNDVVRISGLTIRQTSTTNVEEGIIQFNGKTHKARLDHIHFDNLATTHKIVEINGNVYGVADHNIFIYRTGQMTFDMLNGRPVGDKMGHTTWNLPTDWGTNNFFFIEHNYSQCNGPQGGGSEMDGQYGGRRVVRHNVSVFGANKNHGTENGIRTLRAQENYKNFRYVPIAGELNASNSVEQAHNTRGGQVMFWGNKWAGATSNGTGFGLFLYRAIQGNNGGYASWGGAQGASPWDVNDTTGGAITVGAGVGSKANGDSDSYNPATPNATPYNYYPLAAGSQATVTSGGTGTATVSPTPATAWAGNFTNFGATRLSDFKSAVIHGSNGSTLTTNSSEANCNALVCNPIWAAGNQLSIHRAIIGLDQAGRGFQTGLSQTVSGTGSDSNPVDPFVNNATGTALWPKQALEPVYSWSNTQALPNGSAPKFGTTAPFLIHENRDYYNDLTNDSTSLVSGKQIKGVRVGTLAAQPAQCQTGEDIAHITTNNPGVAYWATDVNPDVTGSDKGALYRCTGSTPKATGSWGSPYYKPYEYPHPCVKGAACIPNSTPAPQITTTSMTFTNGTLTSQPINTLNFVPPTPNFDYGTDVGISNHNWFKGAIQENPTGVTITAGGLVTGTPNITTTLPAVYTTTVKASITSPAQSDTVTFNLTVNAAGVTTPSDPSTLVATTVSSSSLKLVWTDNSSNETSFKIERSLDGASFSQIDTAAADATIYIDTGLSGITKYYYRVRASNSAGDSGYTNIANATTSGTPGTAPTPANIEVRP